MPNWDDQFDFDDLQDNKKKPTPKSKLNEKKTNNYEEEFFDEVNETDKKKDTKSILPNINSKNSAKTKPVLEQSTRKANPFANKLFGSKELPKDDFEDYDKQLNEEALIIKTKDKEPTKPAIQNTSTINKNKSEISEEYNQEFLDNEEPFQESINNNQSSKSIKTDKPSLTLEKKYQTESTSNVSTKNNKPQAIKSSVKQESDSYDEEFEGNDQYADDDFEKQIMSPTKHTIQKVNNDVSKSLQKNGPKTSQMVPKTVEHLQSKSKAPVKTNNLTRTQQTPQNKEQQRGQSVVPPKPLGAQKKNSKEAIASNKNIINAQSKSVSKNLQRSSSKHSIRSNGQKSVKASRISQKNQSDFIPNKHIDMVSKSFPQDEQKLNAMSQIQINKINERMRAMIRKFNEELNDLINKNMLMLKNKISDKNQTIEDRIKELQIQKKSGETAIEVMEKDFDKLQGRQGQLKEEEYQLVLEKQIQEQKNQIKETLKQIITLKRQVDSKGKKLSLKEDQKNAQSIHHLKTNLIQTKKDEEKGDERIQKLTVSQEELQSKISDQDYKLNELISQAKQKGINIENADQIQKKYEDSKLKLDNIKNFYKKSQNLNTTKLEILNHQNQQIRISIRNISSQIANLYSSIDHSQAQSIKLIEKAKEKQGNTPLFAESLDKLQKQIEDSKASNNEYYEARSEVKSRKSDSAKNRSFKNSNEENVQKSMPLRVTQSQNTINESQETSKAKLKFNKKKIEPKLDIQNKNQVNQRVWNHEEDWKQDKKPQNDENSNAHPEVQVKKAATKEKKQQIEEEKKEKNRPFMLKKNKADIKPDIQQIQKNYQKNPMMMLQAKVTDELKLPGQSLTKQDTKQEQSASINVVPRMMRFGRKKYQGQNSFQNNADSNQKEKDSSLNLNSTVINKNQVLSLKLQIDLTAKQQEEIQEKPIFAPKRFNLRNKGQKKDDSYTPSVQKDNSYVSSMQQNISQKDQQSPKIVKKEEYKPKFDFKNEEFKIKEQISVKKQAEKLIAIQESEIKPKFNLRLRDRVNKDTEDDQNSYMPNIGGFSKNINGQTSIQTETKGNSIKIEAKPQKQESVSSKQHSFNLNAKKQPIVNNPYSSYAPQMHPAQQQTKNNAQTGNNLINTNLVVPINNPYAVILQGGDANNPIDVPKRQKGPLKKNKLQPNVQKQSFNIYAQADDITNTTKETGGITKVANQQTVTHNPSPQNQELDLNAMLGIKKEAKKNDFEDLLGDVGIGAKKTKKKNNNDFFNDFQF